MPLNFNRTISDEDMQVLEAHIVDVEKWINDAIDGKIVACKKRLVKNALEKIDVTDDKKEVPTTVKGLIAHALSQPEFKARKTRGAK